jgi:hypothetical protein
MVIVLLGQISSTSPESFFSTGLCRAGMDFPFIYPPALCLLLGFHALAFKLSRCTSFRVYRNFSTPIFSWALMIDLLCIQIHWLHRQFILNTNAVRGHYITWIQSRADSDLRDRRLDDGFSIRVV